MKKAVGGAYVYNLVIIFLLIMLGFFLALFSYTKAYRVSKSVISIIENHSGYNNETKKDIDAYLTSMGYTKFTLTVESCPEQKTSSGAKVKAKDAYDGLCIYEISNDKTYINYGVLSYMIIDLPLINLIKVPIYGETERIYIFD